MKKSRERLIKRKIDKDRERKKKKEKRKRKNTKIYKDRVKYKPGWSRAPKRERPNSKTRVPNDEYRG